jgi:hypothetical protein
MTILILLSITVCTLKIKEVMVGETDEDTETDYDDESINTVNCEKGSSMTASERSREASQRNRGQ